MGADANLLKALGLITPVSDLTTPLVTDKELVTWFMSGELKGDYYDLVRESNCATGDARHNVTVLLEEIGFEVVANTFTQDNKGPSATAFKTDMVGYGLSALASHKLFLYLKKAVDGLHPVSQLTEPVESSISDAI